MPIAYRYESETEAVILTVSGVITPPERKIMVRVAEMMTGELKIRNVVVDCSGLTRDGNVEDAFGFVKLLTERADIFSGIRMAVIPAPDFFYIPSLGVAGMQSAGVTVVECEDLRAARAWLAEGLSRAPNAA
jgi:hypothetical protein